MGHISSRTWDMAIENEKGGALGSTFRPLLLSSELLTIWSFAVHRILIFALEARGNQQGLEQPRNRETRRNS
jgi:hypothetical protein